MNGQQKKRDETFKKSYIIPQSMIKLLMTTSSSSSVNNNNYRGYHPNRIRDNKASISSPALINQEAIRMTEKERVVKKIVILFPRYKQARVMKFLDLWKRDKMLGLNISPKNLEMTLHGERFPLPAKMDDILLYLYKEGSFFPNSVKTIKMSIKSVPVLWQVPSGTEELLNFLEETFPHENIQSLFSFSNQRIQGIKNPPPQEDHYPPNEDDEEEDGSSLMMTPPTTHQSSHFPTPPTRSAHSLPNTPSVPMYDPDAPFYYPNQLTQAAAGEDVHDLGAQTHQQDVTTDDDDDDYDDAFLKPNVPRTKSRVNSGTREQVAEINNAVNLTNSPPALQPPLPPKGVSPMAAAAMAAAFPQGHIPLGDITPPPSSRTRSRTKTDNVDDLEPDETLPIIKDQKKNKKK